MEKAIELNRSIRKIIVPFLETYTLEQLNFIPKGYSNNLFWNIAHLVATQQLLTYSLSGLPMLVSDDFVNKYKKGTKPEQPATQAEVDEVKALLFDTINQTQADYGSGVFKKFNEYKTSIGAELKSVEDAMAYVNFHEGTHLGVILSIKKML